MTRTPAAPAATASASGTAGVVTGAATPAASTGQAIPPAPSAADSGFATGTGIDESAAAGG